LAYASLNATHHSCEDIALLRVLPNMTVVCPGDAWEVRMALRAAVRHDGPVYIRLGKKGEPVVHKQAPDFRIGKGIVLSRGEDVCLLSTGNMLPVALEAAQELGKTGMSAQVVSFHTVKPLDQELLGEVFAKFKLVATVEEHSILGGLGGSVAEWLADQPSQKARLCRLGTDDRFMYEAGEQDHAREFYGLTAKKMAQKVLEMNLEPTRMEM